MSQEDIEIQSSNNARDDSSADEEATIKQESNYEGQGDHDAIEEENKDQILNDDLNFSFIQKLSSGEKGKVLLSQKNIAEIIERNYKSGISEKQLLSKKIRRYLLQLFIGITIRCLIRISHFEKKNQALLDGNWIDPLI